MSTSALEIPRRAIWLSRAGDYLELTKPKIGALIAVTIAAAHYAAAGGQPQILVMLNAMGGVLFVAASASALNQWIERRTDALMQRTFDRPLPARRLGSL